MATRRCCCRAYRLIGQSDDTCTLLARRQLISRQYSFLSNIFERKSDPDVAPLDKTPVSVTLFDKESVLHSFQSNLDNLLSKPDGTINEYIYFVASAVYPPNDTQPNLKAHSSQSLVKLMDAIIYLSHFNRHDAQQRLLNVISKELCNRTFALDTKKDIDVLMHCAGCIASISSKAMDMLAAHINSEFRRNGDVAIKSGELINLLNALGHVPHPSTVDFIVHTCTVRVGDLLPSDLVKIPLLLRKYKIQNEVVIGSILEYVLQKPGKVLDPNELRKFFRNVASMDYLDNDGMLSQDALSLVKTIVKNRLDTYTTDDIYSLLDGIPPGNHLSQLSRDMFSILVHMLLEKIGILSVEGGSVANGNTKNALGTISNGQLMILVRSLIRLDPIGDLKHEANALREYISKTESKLQKEIPKSGAIYQMLWTELSSRIDTSITPAVWKQGGSASNTKGQPLTLSDINIVLGLYTHIVAMDVQQGVNMSSDLLRIVEKTLDSSIAPTASDLHGYIIHSVLALSPVRELLTKYIPKLLYATSGEFSISQLRSIMDLLMTVIKTDGPGVGRALDNVSIEGISKHVTTCLAKYKNDKLGNGKTVACILSQVYSCLTLCSINGDVLDNVRHLLLQLPTNSEGLFSKRCLRNIIQLDAKDDIKQKMESIATNWSHSSGNTNDDAICLHDIITFLLEQFKYVLRHGTSKDSIDTLNHITQCAITQLNEFEAFVETNLRATGDSASGMDPSIHNVWDSAEGLRALFSPPKENRDVYFSANSKISRYFPISDYKGIKMPGEVTTMHKIKKMLQQHQMDTSHLELQLHRLVKSGSDAADLEQIQHSIGQLSVGLNRCTLAVAMFEPLWSDSFLPRIHTQRLVTSALRRFHPDGFHVGTTM
ncbi:prephenate dehydratase, putative [Babesia ovis]|uniref:Prephenate dehydratase, putative n=1 Tax=Babesia ovis TaxID=5869 RepID=A0A9W5TE57_BABOV|nr:prephenate dehydratase, putative [Babesia ovis]